MEQRTEIVHGTDRVVDHLVQFINNAQLRLDVCVDHMMLSLAVTISRLKDALIDSSRRHVRIRYITEITKGNLDYCKELISIVDELRAEVRPIRAPYIVTFLYWF